MSEVIAPFRLRPFFSPRPWGRRDLSSWYAAEELPETAEPIGEAWLTGPAAVVVGGALDGMSLDAVAKKHTEALLGKWAGEREFPLLVKLLFPDDKLSVQVHPDDAAAQKIGQPRGKTECWYTLESREGSFVMCGLKQGVTADAVRASVADNSMEDLLEKIYVKEGDMVFVDAGTVHAIGPNVTLLETQQTSDTTYRMYDYGRPRELHLEQGLGVMKAQTQAGLVEPRQVAANETRLIEQKYFTVDRFELKTGERVELSEAADKPHCLIAVKGRGKLLDTNGNTVEVLRGTAVVVPACEGAYSVYAEEPLAFVRSMP